MTSVPSHGKHDPIAYIYEADHHCPECAEKRFGRDADGWIAGGAIDGEGNPVGVLAPWDEWQQFDGENETLGCSDCGTVIDTYEPEGALW
jgi:hypothetical protein